MGMREKAGDVFLCGNMQVPDGMEVGEQYAFITIIPSVPMKDMGDDPVVRNVFQEPVNYVSNPGRSVDFLPSP